MPPNERQFIFIDETGDPGHPDQRDASRYYQLNLLAVNRPLLGKIASEFSRFRYFAGAGRELERYVGPYLKNINKGKYDYNPRLFRNFVIRKSLESLFQEQPALEGQEVELIFDRFLTFELLPYFSYGKPKQNTKKKPGHPIGHQVFSIYN